MKNRAQSTARRWPCTTPQCGQAQNPHALGTRTHADAIASAVNAAVYFAKPDKPNNTPSDPPRRGAGHGAGLHQGPGLVHQGHCERHQQGVGQQPMPSTCNKGASASASTAANAARGASAWPANSRSVSR